MNNYTLILLVFSATAAFAEAFFDSKKGNPEHSISSIVRFIASIAISFFVFKGFIVPILNATAMLIAFWIVFDPSYNLFKNRNFNYIGKTAFLDKLARKMGADLYGWTALKGVLLAICLTFLSYLI